MVSKPNPFCALLIVLKDVSVALPAKAFSDPHILRIRIFARIPPPRPWRMQGPTLDGDLKKPN